MSEELSYGAIENIKLMCAMAKRQDRPDMIATEIVQEIAEIAHRAGRGRISEADCAVLLGIGSTFVKQAEAEIMAGLQAFTAIRKAGT